MSYPFNCANQQPPSYSGVTINITNPALSVPPTTPYGNSIAQYYPSQYAQGVTNPVQKQYTNKMGLHAFAPSDDTISQNKMNLHAFSSPYGESLSQTQMLQQGQNPNPDSVYPYPYPAQNNGYGINIPYYTPYINGGGYISPAKDYGNNIKKPNDSAPYQTVPYDGNELMPAYPPQYYINGQTYPNGNNINLLPQSTQNGKAEKDNDTDMLNLKENNDDVNTDTSKEIISELDGRRAEEKELEQNGKKTKIIYLTNEYIMSLENYLNNPNTDIRLMAAKEVLTRLDEDRNRYDDAALNALLNKMLQDPNKLVRIAALSAFASELASGNDYTVQLLTQIQNNPDADPEDVLEASQILLQRAATTEVKYTQNNNQQITEDSQ